MPPLLALAIGLFVAAAIPPATDDANDAINALRRAFAAKKLDAESMAERRKAIEGLGEVDSPAAARALVDAYMKLESLAGSLEKQRIKLVDGGPLKQTHDLRKRLDPLRDLQEDLRGSLYVMMEPASLQWMLEHATGKSKMPVMLRRELVVTGVDLGGPAAPFLIPALKKSKDEGTLCVVLEGIRELGTAANGATPLAIDRLKHKSASVRVRSAQALAALEAPQAIEPMVLCLQNEQGWNRRRVASALEILTRQRLGADPEVWSRWFEEHGQKFVSGEMPLGGGESNLELPEGSSFYGISTFGRAIVFIVDISSSMKVSKEIPEFDGGRPIPAGKDDTSRMEALKTELVRALEGLRPEQEFGLVYYSDRARFYSAKLQRASAANIAKATAWVKLLQPEGATNIYQALEAGFALAGRKSPGVFFEPRADALFLMTDGAPMLTAVDADDPDRILEAVRQFNPLEQIVVHCVAMGKKTSTTFLRQLAGEHNGQFVER